LDRLLRALAHKQLGQEPEAEKWCNLTLAGMAKNGVDEGLWQLTAETLAGWLARQPQPDSADVRIGRAKLYLARQQPDQALAEATKAVELQPDTFAAREIRVEIYLGMKKWAEALADCARAVELKPDDRNLLALRGNLNARCGKWAAAADDFRKLAERDASDPRTPWLPWYRQALAHLAGSNPKEYRKVCVRLLERFKDTEDWETTCFTAWACVLGPDAVADFAPVLRLAEKALAKEPRNAYSHLAVGAVQYRMGRLADALPHFQAAEAADNSQGLTSPAYGYCFRAMAHHRLGHQEEARKWLDKAVAQVEQELREDAQDARPEQWIRKATLQLLRAEAEAVLRGAAPKPEK
jgi:tetratricopeptide (TPR) repeat protein